MSFGTELLVEEPPASASFELEGGEIVARSPLQPAAAPQRRARAQQRHQELGAVGEQRRADPEREAERDRGGRDPYEPLTCLISLDMAGTTSCRSPTTP